VSEENLFEQYRGKLVNVGIPNFVRKDRLFFITGVVLSVDEKYITLKIKDGLRKIPFQDIIEISIKKSSDRQ
jgi:hypothetical protein